MYCPNSLMWKGDVTVAIFKKNPSLFLNADGKYKGRDYALWGVYLPHITCPIVIDFKSVVIRCKDTSHAWYFALRVMLSYSHFQVKKLSVWEKSSWPTVVQLGRINAVILSLSGQPQANAFPSSARQINMVWQRWKWRLW